MFWTNKWCLLHWISIECGTAKFWFLLCRNQAKLGKIRQLADFRNLWCDPHSCLATQVMRPSLQPWRPGDATLIPAFATHMMRVASTWCESHQLLPPSSNSTWQAQSQLCCLYKEVLCQNLGSFFPLYIPEHLESRDQERRRRLELTWRRGEEKIARSSPIHLGSSSFIMICLFSLSFMLSFTMLE